MFDGEVIYEKKFPSFEDEVERDILQRRQEPLPVNEEKRLSYEEIVAKITKNNTYVYHTHLILTHERLLRPYF